MTTPSDPLLAGQVSRLHPASLLFTLGSLARSMLIPGIALLWFSGRGNYEIWLMLLFIPAALAALVRYYSYRYRLGAEEMIVQEGIITRNERHIPYSRIQNINLIQNPLHRLLRVFEVHLETAGGEKPEAVMRVLSQPAIDRIRARVHHERTAEQTATGEQDTDLAGEPILRLPLGELVLLGITSNRGLAIVAAAIGLSYQVDVDVFGSWWEWLPGYVARYTGSLTTPAPEATAALGLLGAAGALLALKAFSVLWAVGKFHGFTLSRHGDDLRADYGLFTKVQAAIPVHRIQLLSTRAKPLHRWAGRAVVQVEIAAVAAGGQGQVDHLWLAPLVPAQRVRGIVHDVLPEIDLGEVEWVRVEARAWRRVFFVRAITTLPLVVAAIYFLGLWGLSVPALLGAMVWLHARRFVRHCGYAVTSRAVFYRSGWWVRRMSVVPFNKIQTVAWSQSPFDRRHRMASVRVDTAGAGRVGHQVAVPYLDAATARRLQERLAQEARRTRFRW